MVLKNLRPSPAFKLYLNCTVLEMCSLLRYVERNERPSDPMPWSVRQMGLYQQYDQAANRDIVLLIHASESVQRRILEDISIAPAETKPWEHWTIMPMLVCSSLLKHWHEYVEHLDREACNIVSACLRPGLFHVWTPWSEQMDVRLVNITLTLNSKRPGVSQVLRLRILARRPTRTSNAASTTRTY